MKVYHLEFPEEQGGGPFYDGGIDISGEVYKFNLLVQVILALHCVLTLYETRSDL